MDEMFFEEQQREELREIDREIRRLNIIHGEICPYCKQKPILVDSTVIYGPDTNFGLFVYCNNCQAWTGTHKKDKKPLGRLANKELRALKKEAHMYFDLIWQQLVSASVKKNDARNWAYKWLSEKMGTPPEETHIGMFDEEQCRHVIYHSQILLANGPTNRKGSGEDI